MAWEKGQSGNPKGRPHRQTIITDTLRALLAKKGIDGKTNRQLLAEKLLALALDGNVAAIKEIHERIEGKAVQPIEASGPDGGPIKIAVETLNIKLQRLAEK